MLAIVEGLGPDPARRLVIGLSLVTAGALALACRSAVCARLQRSPGLVVPFAAGLLAVIAIDGLVGGPYTP